MKNILKVLLFGTVLTGCLVSNNSDAGFLDMFSKKEKKNEAQNENKSNKKDDSENSTKSDSKASESVKQDTNDEKEVKKKKKTKVPTTKKSKEDEESKLENEEKDKTKESNVHSGDESEAKIAAETEDEQTKTDKSSKQENIAVVFKDGTKIKKDKILEELGKVSGQIQQQMSFNDLMLLFEMKTAYEKVITDEAKNKKLDQDEEVQKSLKDRQRAVGTFTFLSEQAEKLMTNKELKKFYDDTWDKYIKGTNQISLLLIQVKDQKVADRIKKDVKTEEDLNKIIKEYQEKGKNEVAAVPLEDYPESALPPKVVKEIKSKGANSIIGPFQMQGVFTLFFIKSFHKAKKKEFSDEMIPQMKQLASKEFAGKYVDSLIQKHKVEMYDLNGAKVDFKLKDKKDKKENKKTKQAPLLSKVKDSQVIAKIGDIQKLTVKDLYNMFNIKSLDNEIFGSLAMQLRIRIEEVIQNAIRICIQDKLLSMEMEQQQYIETDKMKKIYKEVEKQHLRNAYFAKTVKITNADAKKEYDKYIKMIKPEDKDDNEVSTKLIFYKTEQEAESAIKEYTSQPKKFTEDFKSKDNAVDLGYVKRQEAPQILWDGIKKVVSGTCASQVINLDGAPYGCEGSNFAVAHISDRRPIKLPTFQETAQMFRKIAEKMQAVAICDELLMKNITSIDGKTYKQIPEEMRHKLLIAVIQGDTRSEQGTSEM